MAHICSIIAKAQITNGGPVILFQPENEYSSGSGILFPNKKYLQYVNDQARNAGIIVPLINNDAFAGGTGAPGTGPGSVDIYVSSLKQEGTKIESLMKLGTRCIPSWI
jgi:hypothetical protein